ncbi:hypothetical protein GOODEAATRI_016326 [Goodea atripinnis]|uniref:Secreted protein n=1 Tax=Goodea atripinnis TaxID=208336 RepID=A0ABV0NWR8_9TELE
MILFVFSLLQVVRSRMFLDAVASCKRARKCLLIAYHLCCLEQVYWSACALRMWTCARPLHVALGEEIEGLHIAWNSRALVLGKMGPQHLLMCPPLYSCAASSLACKWPLGSCDGF